MGSLLQTMLAQAGGRTGLGVGGRMQAELCAGEADPARRLSLNCPPVNPPAVGVDPGAGPPLPAAAQAIPAESLPPSFAGSIPSGLATRQEFGAAVTPQEEQYLGAKAAYGTPQPGPQVGALARMLMSLGLAG